MDQSGVIMANKKKEITILLEHKGLKIQFDDHCYSVIKVAKTPKVIGYATSLQFALHMLKRELFKKAARGKKYQEDTKDFRALTELINKTDKDFKKVTKGISEL